MKQLLKLITTVALISGISIMAEARGGRGHFHKQALKQLDLTTEQTDQLAKLKESQKGMKALRKEKRETRKKFREALKNDASVSELRKLHDAKLNLKTKLATARFEKMMAVRKILTPAQRTQFHSIMQEHRKNRGSRRSRSEH